jgi:hypothetical protein
LLLLPYYPTNPNETFNELASEEAKKKILEVVIDLALKDNKIALVGKLLVAAEGEGISDC